MVTVDDEVRLAELDYDDRREGAFGERGLERAQPVAAEGVKRAEVASKRAGARPSVPTSASIGIARTPRYRRPTGFSRRSTSSSSSKRSRRRALSPFISRSIV
jgi:hypothetical protein